MVRPATPRRGRPRGRGRRPGAREGEPTMADRKGYATVYWGKMPVNFRPQDFPRHEVEAAIGYAERSFRDVSGPGAGLQRADAGRWPGGRHRGRARAGRREGGDCPPARRARALEPRRAAVGGRPAHPGAAQAGDEAQARPEWVSARRPLGAQAHRTGAVRPSGTIPRAAPLSHVYAGAALVAPIHASAWKGCSPTFACTGF